MTLQLLWEEYRSANPNGLAIAPDLGRLFDAVAALIGLATLLAGTLPALHAIRVIPGVALKDEPAVAIITVTAPDGQPHGMTANSLLPKAARAAGIQFGDLLARYVLSADVRMEEGSLRCDANISIRRPGDARLGTKTEVKNLNSFANVELNACV